jgi:hypothetical protein
MCLHCLFFDHKLILGIFIDAGDDIMISESMINHGSGDAWLDTQVVGSWFHILLTGVLNDFDFLVAIVAVVIRKSR